MDALQATVLDQVQLEGLYHRMEKRVYNVVYRWLWNADDAAEVTQEAFLRLWNMRERVRMETVEPLLFRIAVNLASHRRRGTRIRQWLGLEAVQDHPAELDHAGLVQDKQRDATVRSAVEALPEHLRRVVMLCELSGLSYKQVAEVLEIPEGTVGSRRNHALKHLRTALVPLAEEVRHGA